MKEIEFLNRNASDRFRENVSKIQKMCQTRDTRLRLANVTSKESHLKGFALSLVKGRSSLIKRNINSSLITESWHKHVKSNE